MDLFLRLLIIFSFAITMYAKDTIVFAPLPMKDTKTIYNEFYPMVKYLETKLNKKIVFDFSDSYEVLLNKFKTNKIDLVYLGPLPYIALSKKVAFAKPLVLFKNKNGQTTYTCSLVTTLNTKERKKVALTQPLSTCGYLSVNKLLDNKLEEYKYRYIGRHDLVAMEVLKGHYDLGGLKTSVAKDYYHLGLDEIKRTDRLPMFALVSNSKTLSKDDIYEITNALVYTDQKELENWGESIRYGAKKATDNDYDALRTMIKDLKIPQKGNF